MKRLSEKKIILASLIVIIDAILFYISGTVFNLPIFVPILIVVFGALGIYKVTTLTR